MRALARGFAGIALVLAAMLAQAGISVVDDAGRTVALRAPAQRIVSLAPHATELLFELGAGSRVVGASAASDWPAAAKAVPRVGDARAVDLERVMALAPDLVVTWPYTAPRRSTLLRARGVAVFVLDARTIDALPSQVLRLGRLLGEAARAEALAAARAGEIAALSARYRDAARVVVFYQVWNAPLYTIGGTPSHLAGARAVRRRQCLRRRDAARAGGQRRGGARGAAAGDHRRHRSRRAAGVARRLAPLARAAGRRRRRAARGRRRSAASCRAALRRRRIRAVHDDRWRSHPRGCSRGSARAALTRPPAGRHRGRAELYRTTSGRAPSRRDQRARSAGADLDQAPAEEHPEGVGGQRRRRRSAGARSRRRWRPRDRRSAGRDAGRGPRSPALPRSRARGAPGRRTRRSAARGRGATTARRAAAAAPAAPASPPAPPAAARRRTAWPRRGRRRRQARTSASAARARATSASPSHCQRARCGWRPDERDVERRRGKVVGGDSRAGSRAARACSRRPSVATSRPA